MLFSEPKIPQLFGAVRFPPVLRRFSALQRAENSSIDPVIAARWAYVSFSALQRAENSSIDGERDGELLMRSFQCSSASRKFLNTPRSIPAEYPLRGFSALQRAENSSMRRISCATPPRRCFSALQRAENSSILSFDDVKQKALQLFQCSSASRKFLNLSWTKIGLASRTVSVLFSEPKIPQ